jgi:hypothetical protein
MKQVKELQVLHRKVEALVLELLQARKFEAMQSKFSRTFILSDGYLIDGNTLQPVPIVVSDGEIKGYLKRRGIRQAQILDMDNRRKKIFNHKRRGNENY